MIKIFFLDKIVFQFQIKKKIIVKNFFLNKKNFRLKKMDIAKKIFSDQHNTSDLIDLLCKRCKID